MTKFDMATLTDAPSTKPTNEQFDFFKERFSYWQQLFGLNNWNVFFSRRDTKESYAEIEVNSDAYVATVYLTTNWGEIRLLNDKELENVALHEALHLLLGKLATLGHIRFCSEDEFKSSEEEAVNRLVNVIERLSNG